MKPILYLQLRIDKSKDHEQKHILKFTGLKKSQIITINPLDRGVGAPLPSSLSDYSGIITGASGQFNLSDCDPRVESKIKPLIPLFKTAIEKQIPTLAICFGHQLVAQLLGGKVEKDPNQAETGTYQLSLTKEGISSPLYQNIPPKFFAVEGHKDSVVKLPKSATLLASSKRCKNQSYRLGSNFYTTQFHPELDLDGLMWRLSLYPEYLKSTGKTYDQVRSEFNPIPHAKKVLQNFVKLL